MTRQFAYRPRNCEICHQGLEQASTGRPRLTCGDRCRQIKRRRYDYEGWKDKRRREQAKRRAEKQICKWEKKTGLDFNALPAYHHEPDAYAMSLRERLMIYLPRGWRVAECWACGLPHMPDGRRSGTCSAKCQRVQKDYLKRLRENLRNNPRTLPDEMYPYIEGAKRLGLCKHCDDPFMPTRRNRKYCGAVCRKAAWKQRNPGWRCRECGATCKGRSHYCSNQCNSQYRLARASFCLRCKKMVTAGHKVLPNEITKMPPRNLTAKYDYSAFCSVECRDAPNRVPIRKVCEECHQGYFPASAKHQEWQKYCSNACCQRVQERRRASKRAVPDRWCGWCDDLLPRGRTKSCKGCEPLRIREAERQRQNRKMEQRIRVELPMGIPVIMPVREMVAA